MRLINNTDKIGKAASESGGSASKTDSSGEIARKLKAENSQNRLFGIVLSIELAVMIVLFCAIVLPKIFAIVPDVVLSDSMRESAPVGSIAYLDTNIDPAELEPGDIAAYQATSETAVLHRVDSVNADGTFTFKGDANNVCDAAAPTRSEILGRFMFCIPYAGYVYLWVAEHAALVIAAILAFNILIYMKGRFPRRSGNKATSLANKVPVETKG